MREILFRGKRKEHDFFGLGGEWIYGIPIKTHIGIFICFEENPHYCNQYGYMEIEKISKVIPETVGAFTGLTDKNGVKIFEGDIIKHNVMYSEGKNIKREDQFFEIRYSIKQTRFLAFLTNGVFNPTAMQDCEVIGNIHDNAELLEENNEL